MIFLMKKKNSFFYIFNKKCKTYQPIKKTFDRFKIIKNLRFIFNKIFKHSVKKILMKNIFALMNC